TDGAWKVGGSATAGYRVKELLFGQSSTAVGRTKSVTGTMTIAGRSIRAASVVVDLASVSSGKGLRDSQFRNRIMETSRFPTAEFVLTQPINLAKVPTDNTVIQARAVGKLT